MPEPNATVAWRRAALAVARHHGSLSPEARGLLWAVGAGVLFCVLNALARRLTLDVPPMQAQFMRYAFGLAVLVPVIAWRGISNYRPQDMRGQFLRGALHTVGLVLWFLALPRIPLADMTAIGFTTPIFIMIGAAWFLGEAMHWERWLATVIGFAGVIAVVWPGMSGGGGPWHLVMLASAPVFAASFLLTKALTRHETAGTILVWQSLTVSLFSLPLALPVWQPLPAAAWAGFLVCGLLGSMGHYCLNRSFRVADISATQSLKFLELVWASLLGWLVFGELPGAHALTGGALILAATVWVAQREGRRA
jgi:drug/metabolite transporter (DMT)-like permease